MKRYWPIFLALFCWLLVVIQPSTRSGIKLAWQNAIFYDSYDNSSVSPAPLVNISEARAALVRRFPGNRKVEIWAASEPEHFRAANFDYLLKRYPNDPFVLSLYFRQAYKDLQTQHNPGPLTATYTPASPTVQLRQRPQWNRFIALARHGRELEPQNTYFDWILFYGLYATNQDDEARRVLAQAAQKTDFDAHMRDLFVNEIEVYKMAYGSPVPPLQYIETIRMKMAHEMAIFTPAAHYAKEVALTNRQRGQHDLALAQLVNLTKLARTLRRNSYSMIESRTGNSFERQALTYTSTNQPKRARSLSVISLAAYKSDPDSLYSYAKAQGRADIANLAAQEWSETQSWIAAGWNRYNSTTKMRHQIIIVSYANRLRSGLLKTLPLTCFFALAFWWLSRRFASTVAVTPLYWRGALTGLVLLSAIVLSSIFMTWVFPQTGVFFIPLDDVRGGGDLTALVPGWFFAGIPGILLLLAFHQASRWQVKQQGPEATFKSRFGRLISAKTRDLAEFDFGWILFLALRLTFWLALGVALYSGLKFIAGLPDETSNVLNPISINILIPLFQVSVAAQAFFWGKRPKKLEALHLSFRLIAQMMAGYLVMASVVYAVVAFGTLPMAVRFGHDFEAGLQKGEVQMGRTELGLK